MFLFASTVHQVKMIKDNFIFNEKLLPTCYFVFVCEKNITSIMMYMSVPNEANYTKQIIQSIHRFRFLRIVLDFRMNTVIIDVGLESSNIGIAK